MLKSIVPLSRWGRPSAVLATGPVRVECAPPSLCHAPSGLWQRLLFWLMAPAPHHASPPLSRLPSVRAEFLATVADLAHEEAEKLRWRIHNTRSLRELWHLRADVFSLVAVSCSQREAEQRLLMLNRHFPTRAPRSQFAAL